MPPDRRPSSPRRAAPLFAALGDPVRLKLLMALGDGPCSITRLTRLTRGERISRQAIRKHLHVLQKAGLVRGVRRGRENRFQLRADRLGDARVALDRISRQWDQALARLKEFVEAGLG